MKKGSLLLGVIIFSGVAITTMSAFIGWAVSLSRLNTHIALKEQALQIAEAGIEYYRWHLAHDPDDFQDGTGQEGPYVHDYFDFTDTKTGEFSLDITPPGGGSGLVIIESTGTLVEDPSVSRTIRVTLSEESLVQWAIVSNSNVYIPPNTTISGTIHSNKGVRVDGTIYNYVSSALTLYDDPEHTGSDEYAVHTHLKPPPETGYYTGFVSAEAPPNDLADRSDVFPAGREVGVPAIDFVGITQDLAELKTAATASGNYYPASGKEGYHIVLKTNDTYDVYRVNKQQNIGNSCSDPYAPPNDPDWGQWTIKQSAGETFLYNVSFPSDGIIFFEDHVWVEGQIDGARITVAAAKLPDNESQRKHIIINNDIKYTNYDGTDAISLIAQDDIIIGLFSEDDLEIDAAMVAQNGSVNRMDYSSNAQCVNNQDKNSLTIYGTIVSNEEIKFSDPLTGSGYATVVINYDPNLELFPPELFPEASSEYQILTWEEL